VRADAGEADPLHVIAIKPYYEVVKAKMWLELLATSRRCGCSTSSIAGATTTSTWRGVLPQIHPRGVPRRSVPQRADDDRGKAVDLKAITCPLLNLAATRDWIVPLRSAQVLNELVGARTTGFVPIEGAHVTILIDPRARPLWTTMSDFLQGKAADGARA